MKRTRMTVEQKIKVIETHIGKAKIAETCREFDIHPNQFLQWKKKILEAGVQSLNGKDRASQREELRLKKDLAKKDEIISFFTQLALSKLSTGVEENLALKKKRGGA